MKKKINLTPQDRIGNIDWWKCGCECKLMTTFAESFCCRDANEIPDENFKGTLNSKAVVERCLEQKQSFSDVLQNRCS